MNNNKSGKMSSEKFIIKNFMGDFDIITKYCENKLIDLPFKEKVYHVVNNIHNIIICKNPNCDDAVNFRNSTLGYRDYCSNKCISSDPNMIKLKEQKSMEKFGTKSPAESDEVKNKMLETNNKRYGGNSPMSSKEIQKKSKDTLFDNWGVDNPNKHPDISERRVNTFKDNIEGWKQNYKKTSLERYDVEHPWMNNEIHKKGIERGIGIKIKNEIEKIKKRIPYNYKYVSMFKKDTLDVRLSCKLICNKNHIFIIHNDLLYSRTKLDTVICTECNPIGNSFSGLEVDLVNFIEQNYNKEIILNSRGIINPYELDIYLPDINLAIEFNGLYWHSELNKEKGYHLMKTTMCNDNNIQLVHVWEDDWANKKDIIKSMLLNKMGNIPNKIYARKCELGGVSSKEYRNFINENHIQGYSPASHSLGLYYKEELVSLMTFCKPRKMMGQEDREGVLELSRFCNRLNTNVIGGASKLFKNFLNKNDIKEIFSFSDKSYASGNLYKILGFKYSHQSKINYSWVINKLRKHRYNFTKYKLIELGYDKDKSERDIMYEDVGSYRIWNCGQDKWGYKN
jgi:hypothetical protein